MLKFMLTAGLVSLIAVTAVASKASAADKSGVQRERCAQIGERAVNAQSRKDADTASVVGALVIGGIIGAVIVNGMNEKSAAKAGLLSKDAAGEVKSTPSKTSGKSTGSRPSRATAAENARNEVGSGSAWMRRSIRSQQ
jgi:hypothetical protein